MSSQQKEERLKEIIANRAKKSEARAKLGSMFNSTPPNAASANTIQLPRQHTSEIRSFTSSLETVASANKTIKAETSQLKTAGASDDTPRQGNGIQTPTTGNPEPVKRSVWAVESFLRDFVYVEPKKAKCGGFGGDGTGSAKEGQPPPPSDEPPEEEEAEEPKKPIEYTPEKFAGVLVASVHTTTGDKKKPSDSRPSDFFNIGKRLWKSSGAWELFFKNCTQIFNEGNQVGQGPTTVQNMAKVYAAIIAKNPAVQQFVRQFAYVTSGDEPNTTRKIEFKPVAGDAPVPPEAPPLPRRT